MKRARAKTEAKPWGDLGPDTIGFRLDDGHRRLLCERAGRARMTPHEFARYVLVEALHQPERISAIEQAILQLADRVDQGRCDLVTATQALLVAAGGMSQSDAQMLVAKYFQPE